MTAMRPIALVLVAVLLVACRPRQSVRAPVTAIPANTPSMGGQILSGNPPAIPLNADVLPPLSLPPGACVRSSAAMGRPGIWSSDTDLLTDKGITEIEAHYAQQLAAAGWVRLSGGAQGPLVWSMWAVPANGDLEQILGDDNLTGFMYVIEYPRSDLRSVHMQVTSVRP